MDIIIYQGIIHVCHINAFSVFKSALHYECSLQAGQSTQDGEVQQQQPDQEIYS